MAMEALQLIMDAGASAREATQMSNDISHLRTSLSTARLLIDRAEWGRLKSSDLATLLSKLKDTTYNAEDLLRGFDDLADQQKIEAKGRSRASRLVSSTINIFMVWISCSKGRLTDAQSNLSKVVDEVGRVLAFMGLDVPPVQQLMPETSPVLTGTVFGRDEERNLAIEKLGVTIGREYVRDWAIQQMGVPLAAGGGNDRAAEGSAKRLKTESSRGAEETLGHLSVLPMVGIGGVGKTTLAQYIYNDTRVEDYFPLRLWVCVSDIFDNRRITKEIMESIPGDEKEPFNCSGSLGALQTELKKRLQGKNFLLVLDDVWEITKMKWENLCAPLRYGDDGSTVLVTTRFQKVADLVGTFKSIIPLEGLPTAVFREFFSKCAFGEEHPQSYPQLQDIGHKIADRLGGSPLAAKTLGRLLNMELTVENWRTIQNSDLWDLPHEENEILPALQLTYLYLPAYLKRCFAVCSMFPKDYIFERDEMVRFWVAQCLVEPKGNMRLEDVGCGYLDDLRSRFLFQNDPKSPEQDKYVMHDLIHDMAQSVSVDECFLMQGLSCQNRRRMPPHTVRCMSIEVDNEALSRMGGVNHLNKLHSLRFGMGLEDEVSWIKKLSNILFLSLKGCKLQMLPQSICELNSLRYLDISASSIKELPEYLWCLYSLQFLYARGSRLTTINQGVTNLVNLRWLVMPQDAMEGLSKLSGLGKLSSLQSLYCFTVGIGDGQKIGELKGMNQLSESLRICCLSRVRSMEEAAEARLVDKQYLKHLSLQWQRIINRLMNRKLENRVLEGLHPPSSIESLSLENFGGDNFPSWLKQENLPALRSLYMRNCNGITQLVLHGIGNEVENLRTTDATPSSSTGHDSVLQASINSSNGNACLPFKSLTNLRFSCCHSLTNLDDCLSPEYLPSIKSIRITFCKSIVSPPVHNFGGFICLQDLKIHGCSSLMCPKEMVLPHSLEKFSVSDSGELDQSFRPGCCLENLPSLTVLGLNNCKNLESILLNSINTDNLSCLVLRGCSKLSSIGGFHRLSTILHVDISGCPELTEVEQPLLKKGLRTKEEKELLQFL